MGFFKRGGILAGVVLLAAACQGDSGEEFIPPTRTLLPPTLTPTVAAVTLVPTLTDLPSPATLAAATIETASETISPVIQMLLGRTAEDVVKEQGGDADSLRLLSIDRFTWPDETWGCQVRSRTDYMGTDGASGYRIAFSTTRRVYVYHADEAGHFFLCEDQQWLAAEGEPMLLDPITQAMVALIVQDAAQRLALPENEIEPASVLILLWPDSSVGCPKAGVDYEDQITPGYRVVLRAGDDSLLYHASSRHFVLCTPEEEILPGTLRQAVP